MNDVETSLQRISLSEAAKEFAALNSRLQELFTMNLGDSDEADAIRDEMDRPWYAMIESERAIMRGLSEDFNQLLDDRINFVDMSQVEIDAFHLKSKEASLAMDQGDPRPFLPLLRGRIPSNIPALTDDLIRFTQGNVWDHLGCKDAAILFYESAAKYNMKHYDVLLHLLRKTGRHDRELQLARKAIDARVQDPHLILQAAVSILSLWTTQNAIRFQDDIKRLAPMLRSALTISHERERSDGQFRDFWQGMIALLSQISGQVHGHLQSIGVATNEYNKTMIDMYETLSKSRPELQFA